MRMAPLQRSYTAGRNARASLPTQNSTRAARSFCRCWRPYREPQEGAVASFRIEPQRQPDGPIVPRGRCESGQHAQPKNAALPHSTCEAADSLVRLSLFEDQHSRRRNSAFKVTVRPASFDVRHRGASEEETRRQLYENRQDFDCKDGRRRAARFYPDRPLRRTIKDRGRCRSGALALVRVLARRALVSAVSILSQRKRKRTSSNQRFLGARPGLARRPPCLQQLFCDAANGSPANLFRRLIHLKNSGARIPASPASAPCSVM